MGTVALDGFDVIVAPDGAVPVTVAVLAITPASTSAWVAKYLLEQVVEPPGSRVVTGQLIVGAPLAGGAKTSVMVSARKVTVPVLVTRNEYVTSSPATVTVVPGATDLTIVSPVCCVTGTLAVDSGEVTR